MLSAAILYKLERLILYFLAKSLLLISDSLNSRSISLVNLADNLGLGPNFIPRSLAFKRPSCALSLISSRSNSPIQANKLYSKAEELAKIHTKPIYIFRELLTYLENRRISIPGYTLLQRIIGQVLQREALRIEKIIYSLLSEQEKEDLDKLLSADESLHELTLIKKEQKDFGYWEARREIARLETIKDIYYASQRILPQLKISNENIRHYASMVGFYSVYKLKRMASVTYHLYLLCFVAYRFEKGKDNLINTFLHLVNGYLEYAKTSAMENGFEYQVEGNKDLSKIGRILNLFIDDSISEDISFAEIKDKVFHILLREKIPFMSKYISGYQFDEKKAEWDVFEQISKQFKKNLRPIVISLDFQSNTKNDPILAAVSFLKTLFKKQKGLNQLKINEIPLDLIPNKWRKYIVEIEHGKKVAKINTFIPDKYEFMLYRLLARELEAGNIAVPNSLSHKSYEEDLVSHIEWKNKKSLIERLDIPFLSTPINRILDEYRNVTEGLLREVNRRILEGGKHQA